MRKHPSVTTIKKLFALSGNLCAFPNCKNSLVDQSDNLIGQVCHIEAAEKGGERYNPKQTEEQRASFENLILLCANHHITTNDEKTYTVEVLIEMKKKHEERFLQHEYTFTDRVIEQATQQLLNQNNVNSGSGHQTNYLGHEITVNQGMSTPEVIAIVQALYDANFPKLIAIAKEESAKNIAKFENAFRDEVSKNLTPEQLQKFSDPDVQIALYDAVQSAARKDNDVLRKMLSNLIVQRVKNDPDELKQKVLNEAVATVGKLTKDQMKILTLCFIIKHGTFIGKHNWDNFKLLFEKAIKPFIDFKGTRAEIFHLQYAGCGKLEEVFRFDLVDFLRNTYSFVFLKPLEADEVNLLGVSEEVKSKILIKVDERIFFNSSTKQELQELLRKEAVDDFLVDKVAGVFDFKLLKQEEIKEKFITELSWSKDLFDKFEKTSLNHLTLTSVGMAIAIAYYEQIVGDTLDINIWIN